MVPRKLTRLVFDTVYIFCLTVFLIGLFNSVFPDTHQQGGDSNLRASEHGSRLRSGDTIKRRDDSGTGRGIHNNVKVNENADDYRNYDNFNNVNKHPKPADIKQENDGKDVGAGGKYLVPRERDIKEETFDLNQFQNVLGKGTISFKDGAVLRTVDSVDYVESGFEPWYMVQCHKMTEALGKPQSNICPCLPDTLKGQLTESELYEPRSTESMQQVLSKVNLGGAYTPAVCTPRQRVAILIPQRDREYHLNTLVPHLHRILQRQLIDYRIFMVEQGTGTLFNKAYLMNAGFAELMKISRFDCVIFHDVDLMSENDLDIYTCVDQPRHVGVYVDSLNYEVGYNYIFGGAVAMTPAQFMTANGYSLRYYGWGGEDDDMFYRLTFSGHRIIRYPKNVGRFKMLTHPKDTANPNSLTRFKGNWADKLDTSKDGLSSMMYVLRKVEELPLYTRILLEINCDIREMRQKPHMGRNPAPAYDQITASKKKCLRVCGETDHCTGVTWVSRTNNCMLHQTYQKPVSEAGMLYYRKTCYRSDTGDDPKRDPYLYNVFNAFGVEKNR